MRREVELLFLCPQVLLCLITVRVYSKVKLGMFSYFGKNFSCVEVTALVC